MPPGGVLLATLAWVIATAGCQVAQSHDTSCRPGDRLHQQSVCGPGTTPEQAAALSDVVAELDPARPIRRQSWAGVNCMGRVGPASRVAPHGIMGRAGQARGPLRFGIETPQGAGPQAFVFRVLTEDTAFSDGRRCEAVAFAEPATALPLGTVFWYALTLRVDTATAQARGAALLTQWHTQGYNPFMGLYLIDGRLRITLRHDRPQPGQRPLQWDAWSEDAIAPDEWMTFVFRAELHDPTARDGTLQAWRDGQPLFDYTGPLGYASGSPPYAKIGYYHWNTQNPWDLHVPVRTVHVQRAVLLRDPADVLDQDLVRRWVLRRETKQRP